METKTAKAAPTQDDHRRHVVQLIYPDVTLLDVAGPSQVFGNAGGVSPEGDLTPGAERYTVSLVSKDGGPIRTDVGIELSTRAIEEVDPSCIDTLLVSGGVGVFEILDDRELIDWFRAASAQVRRVGSTCMGAFFLAATGLCENQRLTTHWRWADRLMETNTSLRVAPEQIFVRNGRFWSSAGVTSGIDMALAMVEEDLGRKVSIDLAKALLVYFRRSGNQLQYSSRLQAQAKDGSGRFEDLQEWIAQNLQSDLSVEILAQRQGMSARNFARVFSAKMGVTPAKYVERARVEDAMDRLANSDGRLGSIARDAGFRNIESFRRSFLRTLAMPPEEYRQRHGNRTAPRSTMDPVPEQGKASRPLR